MVDVSEFDHRESFKSVINSVLTVLALMLVFGAATVVMRCENIVTELFLNIL